MLPIGGVSGRCFQIIPKWRHDMDFACNHGRQAGRGWAGRISYSIRFRFNKAVLVELAGRADAIGLCAS